MKTRLFSILTGTALLLPLAAHADKAGEALLQKCIAAQTRLKSLQADYQITERSGNHARQMRGTLRLKKPNLAHIRWSAGGKGGLETSSDGRRLVVYNLARKVYDETPVDAQGGNISRSQVIEAIAFYSSDLLTRFRAQASGVHIAGTQMVGNVKCQVLSIDGTPNAFKLSIAPDGTLRGLSASRSENGQTSSMESQLVNYRANAPLAAAAFAWIKPAGAQSYAQLQAASQKALQQARANLPVAGKIAPDFELPQATGGKIRLSSVYKTHKATLLNFWALY